MSKYPTKPSFKPVAMPDDDDDDYTPSTTKKTYYLPPPIPNQGLPVVSKGTMHMLPPQLPHTLSPQSQLPPQPQSQPQASSSTAQPAVEAPRNQLPKSIPFTPPTSQQMNQTTTSQPVQRFSAPPVSQQYNNYTPPQPTATNVHTPGVKSAYAAVDYKSLLLKVKAVEKETAGKTLFIRLYAGDKSFLICGAIDQFEETIKTLYNGEKAYCIRNPKDGKAPGWCMPNSKIDAAKQLVDGVNAGQVEPPPPPAPTVATQKLYWVVPRLQPGMSINIHLEDAVAPYAIADVTKAGDYVVVEARAYARSDPTSILNLYIRFINGQAQWQILDYSEPHTIEALLDDNY